METVTLAQTPDRGAHIRRVSQIVKRLVIDLGYLEREDLFFSGSPYVDNAIARLDVAIDDLNAMLAIVSEKIAPIAETDAESGNLPAVYPTEEP